MLVGVKILMKEEVLDMQARAVQATLKLHKKDVQKCRVGRYIQLEIDTKSQEEAFKKAKEIAKFILCNPLTEEFFLEIVCE